MKHHRPNRNSGAFTLIELLVVIAIIAILAAILFPVFARAKVAAKNSADISNGRQVAIGLVMYLSDYDDQMPIFYAYNSMPPAGDPAHKGVEVQLFPYLKNKDVFRSPFDVGGPYTDIDVPGAGSYWKAYGSSYRFTQCLYTVVQGESSQNNTAMTFDRPVNAGQIEYHSETRAMRSEMMAFFSRDKDPGCARYGYDCDPPYNYFRMWSPTGGVTILLDSHAKFATGSATFDDQRITPDGRKSGEPEATSWSGTVYGICD
ncbi:MAG: prepilin-type N-terminal cleavage/methylation domain-containing protein [Fimbriimonadaceae bacterium]|nr:prepilin-type N-terminal cleavage/methylation domain-containing protein [Fimbriimonadaceae bacterium]